MSVALGTEVKERAFLIINRGINSQSTSQQVGERCGIVFFNRFHSQFHQLSATSLCVKKDLKSMKGKVMYVSDSSVVSVSAGF